MAHGAFCFDDMSQRLFCPIGTLWTGYYVSLHSALLIEHHMGFPINYMFTLYISSAHRENAESMTPSV